MKKWPNKPPMKTPSVMLLKPVGKSRGVKPLLIPADGEQQEKQNYDRVTGTVTVDNLYERPIMSTPFSQYTVTEGLLLLSLLLGLVRTMFRIWNN